MSLQNKNSDANFHTIRLHGPWQIIDSQSNKNGAPSKVTLPEGWNDFSQRLSTGPVQLNRRFGYPTGMKLEQQVWLNIDTHSLDARVFLNDSLVGDLDNGCLRLEVSRLLQPRNGLRLELEKNEYKATAIKHIQLEIEE